MRPLAWLPAAIVVLAGATASAQSAPDLMANRRRLLDQAFEAATRGAHSDAIDLAEQAARIQMSPSIRMFLAQQHEELSRSPEGADHLTEAVTQADACVREATEQTTLNRRAEIMRQCAEVSDRLNPRVARVRLQLPTPAPAGLRVRVNTREIAARDWGILIAVLAGETVVDVSTSDGASFHRALTLAAGRVETVAVVLPSTAHATPTGTPATRIVGLTLLGLGVAAGAFGIFEAVNSSAQSSDALHGSGDQGAAWERYYNDVNPRRTLTPSEVCDRAATDAANNPDAAQANNLCSSNSTARTLAWGFGIGGAALAVGGAALLIASFVRDGASRTSRVEVSPILGASTGGATLRVRF